MKLKNDDLLRLVFAWQTAQISKLTAVNASIPDGTELCCMQQELKLDEKANPTGDPNLHVKMFCWFSFSILFKELAIRKKLLT